MPLRAKDLKRSLDQIEQTDWGEPDYNSWVVIRCHQLRKLPLREFTHEDLGLMIRQQISLQHLLPIALDMLQPKPLIEDEFPYEGSLLLSVFRVPPSFWLKRRHWLDQTLTIVQLAREQLQRLPDDEQALVSMLEPHIDKFEQRISEAGLLR